jgi:hypothetical protein
MKIKDLKNKVIKLIENNEYNLVKFKGISLSRSDLDTILMYCNILEKQGNLNGYIVLGEVKEVFDKCNIKVN